MEEKYQFIEIKGENDAKRMIWGMRFNSKFISDPIKLYRAAYSSTKHYVVAQGGHYIAYIQTMVFLGSLYLEYFGIDVNYQGQGHAIPILNAFKLIAKDTDCFEIRLVVHKYNKLAIHVYKRVGFVESDYDMVFTL
jgi:ribosomal protein S18 acetylase RimI-like enzyme